MSSMNQLNAGEDPGQPRQRAGNLKQNSPPALNRTRPQWPQWEPPTAAQFLELAHLTVPFIRFLAPEVVRVMVEDTEKHRKEWTERLGKLEIGASQYLWERSPTLFPGVRRKTGNKETKAAKSVPVGSALPSKDAIALDDNHYPKEAWAYVFLGTKFRNRGPAGYAQAHIFDHKVYGNRLEAELAPRSEGQAPIRSCHGLFTSIANTVFMPNGLMRPTDFPGPLRNLLQRKAETLYGQCCVLLPGGRRARPSIDDQWSIDAFQWSESVGTIENVPIFLEFRRQTIEDLLAKREALHRAAEQAEVRNLATVG